MSAVIQKKLSRVNGSRVNSRLRLLKKDAKSIRSLHQDIRHQGDGETT